MPRQDESTAAVHRSFTHRPPRRIAGFTFLEIVVVLAASVLVAAIALPPAFAWTRSLRMRLAAAEMVGTMQKARIYAIRHQANVALKFRTDAAGRVSWTLYRDGDGDGVRNRDIVSGRDPAAGPAGDMVHFGGLVRLGFPPGVVPRDPGSGRPMDRLDDPVRFNRSDLASWTPLGRATPGSIYLTDRRSELWAVRVNHQVGRMRVIVYDPRTQTWRRD